MRSLLLASVSILCTVVSAEKVMAGLSLPNIKECRQSATDKNAADYCDALENCMRNDTDDRASLKGCILEAQDAYTAKTMQGEGLFGLADQAKGNIMQNDQDFFKWADQGESPMAPEETSIETQEVNSELVEGIQGEKGWSMQQEGPND